MCIKCMNQCRRLEAALAETGSNRDRDKDRESEKGSEGKREKERERVTCCANPMEMIKECSTYCLHMLRVQLLVQCDI